MATYYWKNYLCSSISGMQIYYYYFFFGAFYLFFHFEGGSFGLILVELMKKVTLNVYNSFCMIKLFT